MQDILFDREIRASRIQDLLQVNPIIISIKANIPGGDKNRFPAHLLVRLFSNLIKLSTESKREFYESSDGPYFLISLNDCVAKNIKNTMVELEDNHLLGRFVDIDVHTPLIDLHRETPRTCIVCHDVAKVCQHKELHTTAEIMTIIKDQTIEYMNNLIFELMDESILAELNLDPKFGLVTKSDSGSHPDMSCDLMIKAKNAILPFLVDIFECGLTFTGSPVELMRKIRIVGLSAEEAMFTATAGVNAYKGLIFNLGFVCAALGRVLYLHLPFSSIFDLLKSMSTPLVQELSLMPNSFGVEAYQKYNFSGARNEMILGLPSVQKELGNMSGVDEANLYHTLIDLIINTEDTTLLKRSDIQSVELVKERFRSLDVSDQASISELTEYCKTKNLTFGGSADLLVVSVFLFIVKNQFFTFFDR